MVKQMQPFRTFILVLLYFVHLTANSATQITDDTSLSIGAINHLTTSFVLLREGVGAQSIRQDILGNVRLAALPKEYQDLYKSLLSITNTALQFQEQHSYRQPMSTNPKKDLDSLVGAATAMAVGDPISAAISLLSLTTVDAAELQQQNNLALSNDAKTSIREAVSSFEFDLSLARGELQENLNIHKSKFVTPVDVEDYLALKSGNSGINYFPSLASLAIRSPALYFASYELAINAQHSHNYDRAISYFKTAIEYTPVVIKASPVRADSYARLGLIASENNNIHTSRDAYTKALEEEPDNVIALGGMAVILAAEGKLSEASDSIIKVLSIEPYNAILNYLNAVLIHERGGSHTDVLKYIRVALNNGWTDLAAIDKAFKNSSIHKAPEYSALLKLNLSYTLNWQMLTSDIFGIINNSEFDMTNTVVSVTYKDAYENPNGWTYIPTGKNQRIGTLKRGDAFEFEAFNSTKGSLIYLTLEVHSDQGSFRTTYKNTNGTLTVAEHKSL